MDLNVKSSRAEIARILEALETTPRRLEELSAGKSDAALHKAADPKGWSAAENLAHLRACADVWTHSMYAMLAEKNPRLADINERKWAKVTGYAELPFERALKTFALQREELLNVLRALTAEDWERAAMIAGRRHTVFTQARRMAKHEARHLEQVASTLG